MPNPYSQYAQPYMNGSMPIPHGTVGNGIPQLKPGQPTLATSAGGGPGYTPGRFYSEHGYGPNDVFANIRAGNPPMQGLPANQQFMGPPTPAPMPMTGQPPPVQMQPQPVPPAPPPQLPGNNPPAMNPYARFGSGYSPYGMPPMVNPYTAFAPTY